MSSGTLETAATANFVTHATWASSRTTKARIEATPKLTVIDAGFDTDTAANLSHVGGSDSSTSASSRSSSRPLHSVR